MNPTLKRKAVADYAKEMFSKGTVVTCQDLREKFGMTQPTIAKALKENNVDLQELAKMKPEPVQKDFRQKPAFETYDESSDVRAGYLFYNGCYPLYTEEKQFNGVRRTAFVFEKTDHLARLLMDYKGSEANKLINCVITFRKIANEQLTSKEFGPIQRERLVNCMNF